MPSSLVPTTMQAAVVRETNGAFEIIDRPVPDTPAGHVLVRISASGVNPLDTKIRAGLAAHAKHPLPAILGMDMAGVVVQVGVGATRFQVGDEVYGLVGGVGGLQGTLAEYVAVDEDLLARKPKNLSQRESAALPLVSITAWEGLIDRARTSTGHKVLVHGGAGGVGHVAIQIARAFGADVYATAKPSQFDVVRSLGATPIDYTSSTPAEYVQAHTAGEGFDVVYDTVGGATLDASFLSARRYTGHVVSALGWGTHSLAPLSFRGATYSGVFTLMPMLSGKGRAHHGEILAQVAKLVDAGQLRPLVSTQRFTLDQAADAHAYVTGGQAVGRVVVDIA
ncbi:zinc-dependent alcohol dehydrogenase family protein [Variovorax sp. Sphag1AA]|uniref:zinc-dependent alcohol dehydrogenase family protein n=1 Tax=Variovorax sp. Sphag1AA TaxID=2587027 RepID=UPI00179DC797|nr:zinc-dependent alcohol dehydrogenase family protein [Variovorax sp. Sphag1AA]MBB3176925.1 NADPH:quinone reductase-like Zn-dependent oxidoreductase [Variovorax sp. Sphag1AA]